MFLALERRACRRQAGGDAEPQALARHLQACPRPREAGSRSGGFETPCQHRQLAAIPVDAPHERALEARGVLVETDAEIVEPATGARQPLPERSEPPPGLTQPALETSD